MRTRSSLVIVHQFARMGALGRTLQLYASRCSRRAGGDRRTSAARACRPVRCASDRSDRAPRAGTSRPAASASDVRRQQHRRRERRERQVGDREAIAGEVAPAVAQQLADARERLVDLLPRERSTPAASILRPRRRKPNASGRVKRERGAAPSAGPPQAIMRDRLAVRHQVEVCPAPRRRPERGDRSRPRARAPRRGIAAEQRAGRCASAHATMSVESSST